MPAYFFHDSGGDDIGPGPFLVALGENVLDVEEAVWGVLAGPTFTDMDWGVSTAIPSGARTYAVRVTENVASVDLTARFTEGADAATLRARLAQLVYTVTGFDPAISGVIVFIEGDLLTPLDDPLTRSDFEDFLPAILIEWPTWESWSAPPVTVRGLARGTFQIEIMFGTTGTGRVIASRTVTIDSVAGWGSFEVTFEASELPTPEPARSLSIRVYETAADGTPINERVQPLSLRTDP